MVDDLHAIVEELRGISGAQRRTAMEIVRAAGGSVRGEDRVREAACWARGAAYEHAAEIVERAIAVRFMTREEQLDEAVEGRR